MLVLPGACGHPGKSTGRAMVCQPSDHLPGRPGKGAHQGEIPAIPRGPYRGCPQRGRTYPRSCSSSPRSCRNGRMCRSRPSPWMKVSQGTAKRRSSLRFASHGNSESGTMSSHSLTFSGRTLTPSSGKAKAKREPVLSVECYEEGHCRKQPCGSVGPGSRPVTTWMMKRSRY